MTIADAVPADPDRWLSTGSMPNRTRLERWCSLRSAALAVRACRRQAPLRPSWPVSAATHQDHHSAHGRLGELQAEDLSVWVSIASSYGVAV
jgi:hypothetical protein